MYKLLKCISFVKSETIRNLRLLLIVIMNSLRSRIEMSDGSMLSEIKICEMCDPPKQSEVFVV